jgi:hypothetical protein
MKARKIKHVLSRGGDNGKGRVNRESEGGRIWWVYLVFMYENRTGKPVDMVLRKR